MEGEVIEPSNAERSEWPDATRAYVEALESRDAHSERIARELMAMAARQSVKTQFGWVHPDCVTLTEAARLLRGEEKKPEDRRAIGVLSNL